jgi:hypothetical protein
VSGVNYQFCESLNEQRFNNNSLIQSRETREESRPFPLRAEELAAKPGSDIKEVSAALTAVRKAARHIRRSLERAEPSGRDAAPSRPQSREEPPETTARQGILRDSSKIQSVNKKIELSPPFRVYVRGDVS